MVVGSKGTRNYQIKPHYLSITNQDELAHYFMMKR
jgi:hypothetical protein